MRRYLYSVPSIMILLYVSFMGVYVLNDFNMNDTLVIAVSIILIIPVIIFIVQFIKCLANAIKQKKYIWFLLLILFSIFAVPYYGSKNIEKNIILKNSIITYIVAVVFLTIITIIYSLTLIGKNTDLILTTKDSKVKFTVTSEWKEKDFDGYSLYAANEKKNLAFGLLTYDLTLYEDFGENEILTSQTGFLKTKVAELELYKETYETKFDDKIIKTTEYVGKKNNEKNKIYKLSTIKFNNANNYVVYVFEALLEDDYNKYNIELNEIIENAKLK